MVSVTELAHELQRRDRAAAIGVAQRGCRRRHKKPGQENGCCKNPAELSVDTASRLAVSTECSLLMASACPLRRRSHDLAGSSLGSSFLPRDPLSPHWPTRQPSRWPKRTHWEPRGSNRLSRSSLISSERSS